MGVRKEKPLLRKVIIRAVEIFGADKNQGYFCFLDAATCLSSPTSSFTLSPLGGYQVSWATT